MHPHIITINFVYKPTKNKIKLKLNESILPAIFTIAKQKTLMKYAQYF